MGMLIALRLRNTVVLLVLATMLCFTLVVSAPGNVAVLVAELRSPKASFEQIRQVEEELGLNDPLPVRYGNWLNGALHGDLGISYKTGRPIGTEEQRYGLRVAVLALPAPVLLRSDVALKSVGPRAFGYDFDYVPFGSA